MTLIIDSMVPWLVKPFILTISRGFGKLYEELTGIQSTDAFGGINSGEEAAQFTSDTIVQVSSERA